ncbi:hypothetical protein SLEP1_g45962 [Rubroshorea leprosula]|uniref:Endonuclease/exonuclease/phosphatase domain-containing protein n=1 Tax=Rubroshorea leprosula TaxID=152421 RepID=A0AAV5LMA9_9ROSI|nr:hypothetical protein SLEP1_g45962 [Rubroshorea leprosula]
MEGVFYCKIRAMGGRLVLLEGNEYEDLKELVENGKDWLGNWFEEIKPWSPNMVARERFAWIRCLGLPPHAWKTDFFQSLGNLWGTFVSVDDSTSKKKRLDVARFLLSTPVTESISKSLSIKVNGIIFTVKFSEEESSDGMHVMNTDFKIKEAYEEGEESSTDGSVSIDFNMPRMEATENRGFEEDDDVEIQLGVQETNQQEAERNMDTVASSEGDTSIVKKKGQPNGQEKSMLGSGEAAEDEDLVSAGTAEKQQSLGSATGSLEGLTSKQLMSDGLEKEEGQVQLETETCRESIGNSYSFNNGERREIRGEKISKITTDKIAKGNGPGGLNDEMDPGKSSNGPILGGKNQEVQSPYQISKETKEKLKEGKHVRPGATESDLFWEDMDSDAGDLPEWAKVLEGKKSKKKKRKVKLCRSVYMKSSGLEGVLVQKKKKKKGTQSVTEKMTQQIIFQADPADSVAGDSIYDSNIQNCNKGIRVKSKIKDSEALWSYIKELGVAMKGDELPAIRRLEEMEHRDKERRRKDMATPTTRNQREIHELVNKHRPEVLFLQETKVENVDKSYCRRLWDSDDMDWVAKSSLGASGGLIIIWNRAVLKKVSVFEGEGYIGIQGLWGADALPCFLCNVYSPCDLERKRSVWRELEQMFRKNRGCWCLGGDFNAIRSLQERKGGKSARREVKEFEQFIVNNSLTDLPLLGRKYTWYQPNGQCMSRLDRFLFNDDWMTKWPDLKQWGLARSLSDHCPILVKNETRNWGPKPFKFFNAWLHTPGFREMVAAKWKEFKVQGWGGFIVKEKLKLMKDFLREWSKSSLQDVDRKIEEAKKEINRIDRKGETCSLTDDELMTRSKHYANYFHKSITARWRRNEINIISVEGRELKQVDEIKQGIMEYFQKLFTDDGWSRPTLQGLTFRTISDNDRSMLTQPFTEEEVKEVVWTCDSTKAPGPDGFNFGFLKAQWEVMKEDVLKFLMDFHKNGRLVRGSNASFIVLIPKKENPQGIEEYRPISLIGCIYKILAKLLANRLSKVLNGIIGENQSAFIEGRQLVDGVVVANEAIDGFGEDGSQSV